MRSREQIYIAGFLTWLAGFVDAIGFLALVQIYTANMSGNSVALGIQLWDQNWMEAARRAWPVAVYVLGLLLGRILIEIGGRLRFRSIASVSFCLEIVILLPASLAHSLSHSQSTSAADFELIGLLALAMGLQNATLTHFSSLTLHTGFVTGTLVKMIEQFTKYLAWSFDELRQHHASLSSLLHRSAKQKDLRAAVLLAAIWTAYVVGALCGAAGRFSIDMRSLFIPIIGLAALMLIDVRKPLAVQEEEEQVKLP